MKTNATPPVYHTGIREVYLSYLSAIEIPPRFIGRDGVLGRAQLLVIVIPSFVHVLWWWWFWGGAGSRLKAGSQQRAKRVGQGR